MFLWRELSLVSLALPLLGTEHALYFQENMPSGLFGSSVLDRLTTIGRKEDKFKVKLMGVTGERAGEQGANEVGR